ncbi:13755_t:CDS:2 [Racocetra fulgida]|uniref:13755_t:CDS:1 n=1 Tax=Racocetra fulgida TaxID=60492 RepID=A0A9N8W045_9GLOM|nr:13755_t:CDS:2 [Racocetra fulgida]
MFTETRLTNITNEPHVPFTFKNSESKNNFPLNSNFLLFNDPRSRNHLEQTIDDLCNLYDVEEMKGNYAASVLNLMDQFLATRNLKPEDLINWSEIRNLSIRLLATSLINIPKIVSTDNNNESSE